MNLPRVLRNGSCSSASVANGDVSSNLYTNGDAGPKAIFYDPFTSAREVIYGLERTRVVPYDPVIGRASIFYVGALMFESTFSFRLLFLPTLIFIRYRSSSSRRQFGQFTPCASINANRNCVAIVWVLSRQGLRSCSW